MTTNPIKLQPGDILGFTDKTLLSTLVQLATGTRPGHGVSHVAIVAPIAPWKPNELVIFESRLKHEQDCLIRHQRISGVQAVDIQQRITTHNGKIWLYRLREPLTDNQVYVLSARCRLKTGIRYDIVGALHARETPIAKLLRKLLLKRETPQRMYCAEFVADILRSIGKLTCENISYVSPARLLEMLTEQGRVENPIQLRGM